MGLQQKLTHFLNKATTYSYHSTNMYAYVCVCVCISYILLTYEKHYVSHTFCMCRYMFDICFHMLVITIQICSRFVRHMFDICLTYVKHIVDICLTYASPMFDTCLTYVWHMFQIRLTYVLICSVFHIRSDIIFFVYAWLGASSSFTGYRFWI